jgi:hypothetical protein
MSKDKHTKQNTLFRQPRKSGNTKIQTSKYVKDYDYYPLDIDNITDVECNKCSSIFSGIKNKRCPYCDELDNYLTEDPCDFMSYIDKDSYGEWMTSYNILTLSNVVDTCWWSPNKLEIKREDYYLEENKEIIKKYQDSRIYLSGQMVYYGKPFKWFNEQLIYYDDPFEELTNNSLIIEEAKKYHEKMKDDHNYYCLTDTSYITNYLFKYHKSQFMIKERIPFRKVFGINYSCDICQIQSWYRKDDIRHFNIFLTSRNADSILECQDYCDCSATRVRNYDYCQQCFFNLPLQKARQYLLLTRIFYKYDTCIDDILYHCSNFVSEYKYIH